MKHTAAVLLLAFTVACGDDKSSPTAPTPTTNTPTTLSGTVSSSAGVRIPGAVVAGLDGINLGRTATANANGEYRFDTIQSGNTNFGASASGFIEDRRGISLVVNQAHALNFTLAPVPVAPPPPPPPTTVVENLTGTLSAGDAACASQGIHDGKPCRRHAFTVANAGTLEATLTWSTSNVDLDLELWRGTSRVTSTLGVTTTETISSTVTPGSYELRVVYYQGATIQNYSLRVTRPN